MSSERREDLLRARSVIWDRLDAGEEAAAPLIGQLRQVARELAELAPEETLSAADEAKAKVAKRRLKLAK